MTSLCANRAEPHRFLDAALRAARRGWHVFPLRPDSKKPAVKDWEHTATIDTLLVHELWPPASRYNIAIATGRAGLHVVDLDGIHLPSPTDVFSDAMDQLSERLRAEIPETWTVATPRGWHLYFRTPTGLVLPSTVARIAPGIDTRGRGGYVVAAGSHTRLGSYRVFRDHPMMELPAAASAVLARPPRALLQGPPRPVSRRSSYLEAILTAEKRRITTATTGSRNVAVFRSALVLGRLVAGGEISDADARSVLHAAASRHIGIDGFTADEVQHAVDNAFRYAAHRPRRL